MSLIKLINNKNVIPKFHLSRLLNPLTKNNSKLPSYTLLENSPVKHNRIDASENSSIDSQEKIYNELLHDEYSTIEKYLKYLFGVNVKKRDDVLSQNHSRELHQTSKNGKNRKQSASHNVGKPVPKLLYIQNPVVWLTNKLDFRYLKNWDPQFSEAEFTRGARQAVSTITELLSKNMFDALKPLLTKSALLNLRKDVEILWADEVRRNIALSPSDIQLIIPRKLHFRNVTEKKLCDIDMVFIALKWLENKGINTSSPLVFIDIIVRFRRNYSDGITPDWTISAFKVRRFNVVPQKN